MVPDSSDAGEQEPDAGEVGAVDSGALDAGPMSAGFRFQLHATLPMRPRAIGSLGDRVWVVGDSNAMYRLDPGDTWQLDAPDGGAGVDWLAVRGDSLKGAAEAIWAIGENHEGAFLYDFQARAVRPIVAEGVSVRAPRLIHARLGAIWVSGTDGQLGALLTSSDRGRTWQGLSIPDSPPFVAGSLAAVDDGTHSYFADPPRLFTADGRALLFNWTQNDWVLTPRITQRAVLGPSVTWVGPDPFGRDKFHTLLAATDALLLWDSTWRGDGSDWTRPVDLGIDWTFRPTALWSSSGVGRPDLWAAGAQSVFHAPAAENAPVDGYFVPTKGAIVAIHGTHEGGLWLATDVGEIFSSIP